MAGRSRITGIGASLLKYLPILAIGLAIYQYYRGAGGIKGFIADIKNIRIEVLQAKWTSLVMGVGMFIGADVVARYVPGKLKYVVKAVMYYFGASQLLGVLQGMSVETKGYGREEYFEVLATGSVGG